MGDNSSESSSMEAEQGSGKIDMSLDDIIKLDKRAEDTTKPASRRRSQQTRTRNVTAERHQNQFQRGAQQNEEGPYRFRPRGFGQQGYRRKPWNFKPRPSTRKIGDPLKGISPLNRQISNQVETLNKVPAVTVSNKEESGMLRRQPQRQGRFKTAPATVTRIPVQNRGTHLQQRQQRQRQQRQTEMNLSRRFTQQTEQKTVQTRPGNRRWPQQKMAGSMLTVSVPNPRVGQQKIPQKPRLKRPVPTTRKDAAARQPKGVPLRFNFRAMANQTKVTLNERFSTLKIRGTSTVPRRGTRTVMLA